MIGFSRCITMKADPLSAPNISALDPNAVDLSGYFEYPADTWEFSLRCSVSGAPEPLLIWKCAPQNTTAVNCSQMGAQIRNDVSSSTFTP